MSLKLCTVDHGHLKNINLLDEVHIQAILTDILQQVLNISVVHTNMLYAICQVNLLQYFSQDIHKESKLFFSKLIQNSCSWQDVDCNGYQAQISREQSWWHSLYYVVYKKDIWHDKVSSIDNFHVVLCEYSVWVVLEWGNEQADILASIEVVGTIMMDNNGIVKFIHECML